MTCEKTYPAQNPWEETTQGLIWERPFSKTNQCNWHWGISRSLPATPPTGRLGVQAWDQFRHVIIRDWSPILCTVGRRQSVPLVTTAYFPACQKLVKRWTSLRCAWTPWGGAGGGYRCGSRARPRRSCSFKAWFSIQPSSSIYLLTSVRCWVPWLQSHPNLALQRCVRAGGGFILPFSIIPTSIKYSSFKDLMLYHSVRPTRAELLNPQLASHSILQTQ